MSYEYMSGMGLGKNGETPNAEKQQPAAFVPSPGWLNPDESAADVAAHAERETRQLITGYNEFITRARSGDQQALQALRQELADSDNVEALAVCARGVTQESHQQLCETLRAAQAVVSGQTPASSSSENENGESNMGLYIGLGVGAGVLVLLGIVVLSKKKRTRR